MESGVNRPIVRPFFNTCFMRQTQKTVSGSINQKGGLVMYMTELNDFLKDHKGCKVVATFTVLKKEASFALKGYYFNYVVPTFKTAIWQSGERKTEQQTEYFLREISPIMYKEVVNVETGKYNNELREINELSNPELIEHIETLKQIAAEEYGVFIDDPKTF